MKQVVSFTVKIPARRNDVARAMLDRDGPFKPRSVQRAKAFKRKPKHIGKGWE